MGRADYVDVTCHKRTVYRAQGKARQGKARQGKARQGKPRQSNAAINSSSHGLPLADACTLYRASTS